MIARFEAKIKGWVVFYLFACFVLFCCCCCCFSVLFFWEGAKEGIKFRDHKESIKNYPPWAFSAKKQAGACIHQKRLDYLFIPGMIRLIYNCINGNIGEMRPHRISSALLPEGVTLVLCLLYITFWVQEHISDIMALRYLRLTPRIKR